MRLEFLTLPAITPDLFIPLLAILWMETLCFLVWRKSCHAEFGISRTGKAALARQLMRMTALLTAVGIMSRVLSGHAAVFCAAVAGLFWAICELAVMVAYKYLGVSLLQLLIHTPISTASKGSARNIYRAIHTYLPVGPFAWLGASGSAAMALCAIWPEKLLWSAFVIAIFGVIVRVSAPANRTRVHVHPAEMPFLTQDDTLPTAALMPADRGASYVLRDQKPQGLQHILLVINESAGDDVTCHDGRDLADAICAASPDASAWLRPSNPVTPSSCTDIAVPCIFTGCAPQEDAERLHTLPLLFDLAKARGMTTLFYSSPTLRWANLERFFGKDDPACKIDCFATPESTGLPYANELGCDDHQMTSLLCDRINETSGPLFMVLYTYALHLPFQKESRLPIPAHIAERRSRAAYLIEQTHRQIFDALRQTGRYDDTLVISVGDHGEASHADINKHGGVQSRLSRLAKSVTRPLFVIKPPARLPLARRACLENNMTRLLSTIDIAPTIASLLEVDLVSGGGSPSRYHGYDLTTQAVPPERVHYTLNVNSWRAWPLAAAMVASQSLRLCIDYQSSQTLCCDGSGQPISAGLRPAADALLQHALAQPVVRKIIARVFRDKLHNQAKAPVERFVAIRPEVARPQPVRSGYDAFFGHDILLSDPAINRLHFAGKLHDAAGFQLEQNDQGILLHGPYAVLDAGHYCASFVFTPTEQIQPFKMDVCANQRPCIAVSEISDLTDRQVATIHFELKTPVTGLAVRMHIRHGFNATCLGLFLTQVAAAALDAGVDG